MASKPQVTRRGVGGPSLRPRDPLPTPGDPPPPQGTPGTGEALPLWQGFEKGEKLSIWSIVYHLLIVAMLLTQPQRRSPHRGGAKKQAILFCVLHRQFLYNNLPEVHPR